MRSQFDLVRFLRVGTLQVVADSIDPSKEGTDWTADEVAVLVGSYFLMLAEERAGRDYNKSEYRRSVIAAIGRKPGSIERKLQNVSAILDEIGVPWINGYKPLPHYQDALVAVVEQHLLRHPELFTIGAGPLRVPDESDILVAPPAFLNSDPEQRPWAIRRLVGKFDPAARDARNRDLGRAGEEFVVAFERRRLERAGKPKLAKDVRWVSELEGDGLGYDVQSFDADSGEPRLLEIKTTCGSERTPFWMSRRECDVATEQSGIYRVRRVFHFRNEVKMFDIAPPLEAALRLTPTTFVATPR
ncbi:DUF3883 domain-containing protein [Bradyrhizobium viridifuturi]|uniref:DUF3883 domain-containing protein n=1 Tax=Bradyrhizobium viridifuturi TaxID=1654716 RepID=UPI000A51B9DB|nr:DUF3883 domain-containing protein [Bradyrhizobium viridifuturi]